MQGLLKRSTLIIGVLLITALLILFPEEALEASLRGISIWAEVVFPSLLPFFILAELLISLGAISIIGVLFEPLMRPLFKVPGTGSLALIMGFASGYPTGAKITAKLRKEGKLNRVEAERLVSFTNASSPLFILGAIAIGFFKDAKIGLLIAISHYASNIILGLVLRFIYKDSEAYFEKSLKKKKPLKQQIKKEVEALASKPSLPLGQYLGKAVKNSVQTLIMIGGFITLFSVITSLLLQVNILPIIAKILQPLFSFLQFPDPIKLAFLTGIFEISIGVEYIASQKEVALLYALIAVSFLLGFNGLSIQAQVASLIAQTDIRFSRYFFARVLQGIFSALLTFLLYQPFFHDKGPVQTLLASPDGKENILYTIPFLYEYGLLITIITLGITSLLYVKNGLFKNRYCP